MTRLLAVVVACFALIVVVAGCGGDDEGSTDTGGGATSAPAETSGAGGGAAAPAGGKGKEVVMKDIKFSPATVNVKTGETVTWKNDDSVGHDVTADDDSFSSGDAGGIQPGQDYAHEFAKAGTFKYVCTVHPGMEGDVVVK